MADTFEYYCNNCKQTTITDEMKGWCRCGAGCYYFKLLKINGEPNPNFTQFNDRIEGDPTRDQSSPYANAASTAKSTATTPTYYHGRDVMDIINKFGLSFCLGNVVKYVLRQKKKGGLVDLEKAQWYLNEEIRIQKENESECK